MSYSPFDSFRHSLGWMVLVLFPVVSVQGQSAVDWDVVAAGGGASSGGDYTLQGTVGQAATGVQTGGPYTLTAGFWSLAMVVETPGAPTLLVSWDTGGLRLSWVQPAEGWVLQETDALSATSAEWTTVEGPYEDSGTHWGILLPASAGQRFYRLQK